MQGDPVFVDSFGCLWRDQRDRIETAKFYAGEDLSHRGEVEGHLLHSLKDPLVSPHFAASVVGLPPVLLLAADEDLSVDDAVDFADKLARDGVEVDLAVWPRMWHCFVMYTEGRDKHGHKREGGKRPLKEAVLALEHVGKYLRRLAERGEAADDDRSPVFDVVHE